MAVYFCVFVIVYYYTSIATLGVIFPNVMSLLLEHFKTISVTATALNGVVGFEISAIVGFIASLFHDGGLDNIFYLMMSTSFMSLVILLILIHRKKIIYNNFPKVSKICLLM